MFFSITSLIENLMKKSRDIYPNKFVFLTLVRKTKTRGATESQSRNSKVN